MIKIYQDDAINILPTIEDNSIDLIITDPPYGTNKIQTRKIVQSIRNELGSEKYKGRKYKDIIKSQLSYSDKHDDYLAWLYPYLNEMYRVLSPNGSLYLMNNYHNVHYVKLLLDSIFGEESFTNEIIWYYEWGAKSHTKWSAKHDTILYYRKNPNNFTFNHDEVDRIPYLAPSLQERERAELGKTVTDWWFHTIVPTNGAEKTGLPNQKPLGIIERMIKVSSNPNDLILDCFAGSGVVGMACQKYERRCILIDNNPVAIDIMKERLLNEQNL